MAIVSDVLFFENLENGVEKVNVDMETRNVAYKLWRIRLAVAPGYHITNYRHK